MLIGLPKEIKDNENRVGIAGYHKSPGSAWASGAGRKWRR
jgi:hypothetical protein